MSFIAVGDRVLAEEQGCFQSLGRDLANDVYQDCSGVEARGGVGAGDERNRNDPNGNNTDTNDKYSMSPPGNLMRQTITVETYLLGKWLFWNLPRSVRLVVKVSA